MDIKETIVNVFKKLNKMKISVMIGKLYKKQMKVLEIKNKICTASTNQKKGRVAIPVSDQVYLKAGNTTGGEELYSIVIIGRIQLKYIHTYLKYV